VPADGACEGAGAHPAPGLREVASIWWDVDRDPEVTWDASGRRFDLVDPRDRTARLRLAVLAAPATDPARVAAALAEGLAACDFPPTEDGVPPATATRALRAQGVVATLAD
jgi:hypothetical protein